MGFIASTSIEVKIVRASLGASTEKSEGIVRITSSFFATEGVEGASDATGEAGDGSEDITSGASPPFVKYRNPPPANNATITKTIINPPTPLDLTTGAGKATLLTSGLVKLDGGGGGGGGGGGSLVG
jgi:hypothetical protein